MTKPASAPATTTDASIATLWTGAVAAATPRVAALAAAGARGISTLEQEIEFARQIFADAERKAEKGKRSFLTETFRANPTSLANALVQLHAAGLSLNPVLGLAYLIPRDGRINMSASYKGLIFAARRSGEIEFLDAAVIYANDVWKYMVDDKGVHFRHDPAEETEAGAMVAAYAWARLTSGAVYCKRLGVDAINARRDAGGGEKGPGPAWRNWYAEMSMVKAVRYLYRFLPIAPDSPIAVAVAADEGDAEHTIRNVTPPPDEKPPGYYATGASPANTGAGAQGTARATEAGTPTATAAEPAPEASPAAKAGRLARVQKIRNLAVSLDVSEPALCHAAGIGRLTVASDEELSRAEARLADIESSASLPT